MGYTHYWTRPTELDAKKFTEFANIVRTILDHLPEQTRSAGGYYGEAPLALAGPEGTGPAQVDEQSVAFNGAGQFAHETFALERVFTPWHRRQAPGPDGRWGAFCKTDRKPYDLAVCAALIALRRVFGPEVTVQTDGQEGDWQPALEFYRQRFGEEVGFSDLVSDK